MITAEIGDVTRFKTAAQLCSWAGLNRRFIRGILVGNIDGDPDLWVFVGHLRVLARARFAAGRWHVSEAGRTNEWAARRNISLSLMAC